jgi:hypothetical protein
MDNLPKRRQFTRPSYDKISKGGIDSIFGDKQKPNITSTTKENFSLNHLDSLKGLNPSHLDTKQQNLEKENTLLKKVT